MPSLKEKLTQEAILSQEPGRDFLSNVSYHLLETLIEEVTGISIRILYAQNFSTAEDGSSSLRGE